MNKVLVVDDDEYVRNVLRRVLLKSNPGVEVEFATSVSEAISVIEMRDDFTALLTDFDLGDGNGNDVARCFVAKFPEVPVFGMTGNANHSFDPSIFKQILEKPFASHDDRTVLHSICS